MLGLSSHRLKTCGLSRPFVKWFIIGVDGDYLKGIDITPIGYAHILHIFKSEVSELVFLKR